MVDRAGLVRLRQELSRDLAAAERLLSELRPHAERLRTKPDAVLCGYVAVTLHQLYTALETAFERVCRVFEEGLPAGPDAHQALLRDMALDLPDVRPALLVEATVEALWPLLRFRRFVRHAYAVAWNAQRLIEVWQDAERAMPAAASDVRAFIAFIDETARQMDKG